MVHGPSDLRSTARGSRWALFGAVLLLATACAVSYEIVKRDPGPALASATRGGLTLVAHPEAWQADPIDLRRYVTPIWVRIENHGDREVALSYADFALTNARGFRYRALNPYSGAPAARPVSRRIEHAAPVRVAVRGWIVVADNRRGRPSARGDRSAPAPRARGDRRGYAGPRAHRGYRHRYPGYRFRVYPRRRLYFDLYAPWGGPIWWPPYYGAWVYRWGPTYSTAVPSPDVLRLGLPEGVLEKGGAIGGFIYFQNVGAYRGPLTLHWTPHATDGASLPRLAIAFSVVDV